MFNRHWLAEMQDLLDIVLARGPGGVQDSKPLSDKHWQRPSKFLGLSYW